jgi:hypothetical protein
LGLIWAVRCREMCGCIIKGVFLLVELGDFSLYCSFAS